MGLVSSNFGDLVTAAGRKKFKERRENKVQRAEREMLINHDKF
jgi:hypothetical protein